MSHSSKLSSLSIFMPAYNEAGNIQAVVEEALETGKRFAKEYEVIVVDDGSTDNTKEQVKEIMSKSSRVKLISHRENLGYGAAVKSGLKTCRYDWIFFTDSDRQFRFDEFGEFVKHANDFDLIMGYRRKRMDPFHRVFVAQVLLKVWNFVLFGLTVRDVDCAYKLLRKEVRDKIKLKTQSAITVSEFIIKAKLAGFRIKQLPVKHYPRTIGKQTGGSWRVILRAAVESGKLFEELRLQ